jgi:GntR family transcriptional regulator / MocR family aminotransferase
LGAAFEVVGAEAGMYLTVLLPKGFRDVDIAVRAAREALWVVPLSPAYIGPNRRQGLLLGFGNTSVEHMPRALRQLKSVLTGAKTP